MGWWDEVRVSHAFMSRYLKPRGTPESAATARAGRDQRGLPQSQTATPLASTVSPDGNFTRDVSPDPSPRRLPWSYSDRPEAGAAATLRAAGWPTTSVTIGIQIQPDAQQIHPGRSWREIADG